MRCPTCGADTTETLLAVCDVLTVKALERIGQFLVRGERGRYQARGDRPWHTLHTVWPASDDITARALRGAWDVVPPLVETYGCCDVSPARVVHMLDAYVHDLVLVGEEHTMNELRFRFEHRLNIHTTPPAPEPAPERWWIPDGIAEIIDSRHLFEE